MGAIAVALALGCALAGGIPPLPEPAIGTVEDQFDIQDLLPAMHRVTQVVANTESVYFLISARASGMIVLQTDPAGVRLGTAFLRQGNVGAIDVDEEGRLNVLGGGGRNQSGIYSYEPDGRVSGPRPIDGLDSPPVAFRVIGGIPTVLTLSGGLFRSSLGGNPAVRLPSGSAVKLAPLPYGRIVAAELARGELYIGVPDRGLERHVRIATPETEYAKERSANYAKKVSAMRPTHPGAVPMMRSLVLRSVATDTEGDIYVTLGPFKVSDGAPVLRFDSSGTLKRRLRCMMPELPGTGVLFRSHLAVIGESLLLVDPRGTVLRFRK